MPCTADERWRGWLRLGAEARLRLLADNLGTVNLLNIRNIVHLHLSKRCHSSCSALPQVVSDLAIHREEEHTNGADGSARRGHPNFKPKKTS